MSPSPITGPITLVEFCANRADGFTRVGVADHAASHVVFLGHEAAIEIDGEPASFPEWMAWVARPGGVSEGTFHPDTARYFAATRAEFRSR